jgi:hypothetical protein
LLRTGEALVAYEHAIELQPEFKLARSNHALADRVRRLPLVPNYALVPSVPIRPVAAGHRSGRGATWPLAGSPGFLTAPHHLNPRPFRPNRPPSG